MGIFSELLEEEQEKNKELRKQLEALKKTIEELQYEIDTTRGLWCADQPEVLTEEQKKVFWQLK